MQNTKLSFNISEMSLYDWLWFLNNFYACHPFEHNPEIAHKITTKFLQDLDILPFGDAKNELTY